MFLETWSAVSKLCKKGHRHTPKQISDLKGYTKDRANSVHVC
jgi:hypothetical protein